MNSTLESVSQGEVTPWIQNIAKDEGIDLQTLCERIASGRIVIMRRKSRAIGIGEGLSTKINLNLGSSTERFLPEDEIAKTRIAEKFGADTISDLSMGGDINGIRRQIFKHTTLPVTTVPIYQTAAECGLGTMTSEDILRTIRTQVRQGVSSIVLHCVNQRMLGWLKKRERIMGMVSKGGSITGAHMNMNHCENPFIENFDEVLEIVKKHDIVLSLGNTARSGCIHDRRDRVQIEELRQNLELAHRAHAKGIQVIIEGAGGHIRLDKIRDYIRYYKRKSPFPLFVAGPLPTDIAFGYDHIAGCVGASIASGAGADYLCAITPAEHLGLPGPAEVKDGLIAYRIAAHIGDMLKYGRDEKDRSVAERRTRLDLEGQMCLALDRERAEALSSRTSQCTMCGDFCAIKLMRML
jgi:phosphomethylpyrimidine synthase